MKLKNLLYVKHITDNGRLHDMVFDLNAITIHCIVNNDFVTNGLREHCVLCWILKDSGETAHTVVTDTYESLINRIFGYLYPGKVSDAEWIIKEVK